MPVQCDTAKLFHYFIRSHLRRDKRDVIFLVILGGEVTVSWRYPRPWPICWMVKEVWERSMDMKITWSCTWTAVTFFRARWVGSRSCCLLLKWENNSVRKESGILFPFTLTILWCYNPLTWGRRHFHKLISGQFFSSFVE